MTIAHVVGTLNSVSVMAMAPVIQPALDLSVAQIGFLVTGYYTAQTLCALPAGALVDRLGVGRVLMMAHALLMAGSLLFANAGGFATALLATTVMGVGYSLVNPATAKGVFLWFSYARRATAMGFKQTGVPIGGILAAGNAALVVWFDWRLIMVAVAVLTFISLTGCVWLALTTTTASRAGSSGLLAGLAALTRDRNIMSLSLASVPWNMGQASFFAFLTLFMHNVGGYSQAMAGACLAMAQASSALGRVGWGAVSDTVLHGRRKLLTVGLCTAGGLTLIAMTSVSVHNAVVLGFALSVALGASIAAYPTLAQTLAVEAVSPRNTGAAMGYSLLGTSLGGALGPALFGSLVDLSDGDFDLAWTATGVLVLVASLCVFVVFREGGDDAKRG